VLLPLMQLRELRAQLSVGFRSAVNRSSQSRGYLLDPWILSDAEVALGRAETPAMVGDDAPGSVISHLPQTRSNSSPRSCVDVDSEHAAKRALVSRV
jgi:hypothetical protein